MFSIVNDKFYFGHLHFCHLIWRKYLYMGIKFPWKIVSHNTKRFSRTFNTMKRSWVQIPALYTGWTFFTLICCKKFNILFERSKNKRKREKTHSWPSGCSRRLVSKRSWVKIPALDIFDINLLNYSSVGTKNRWKTDLERKIVKFARVQIRTCQFCPLGSNSSNITKYFCK